MNKKTLAFQLVISILVAGAVAGYNPFAKKEEPRSVNPLIESPKDDVVPSLGSANEEEEDDEEDLDPQTNEAGKSAAADAGKKGSQGDSGKLNPFDGKGLGLGFGGGIGSRLGRTPRARVSFDFDKGEGPFTSPIKNEKNLPRETVSAIRLANALAVFTQPGTKARPQDPRKIIRDLDKAGLKPIVSQDFNPETGKMLMMRTESTMPGTRYIHVQSFEVDGKTEIQHMSYEIKPGPKAMETALTTLNSSYGDLGKPEVDKDDYKLWRKDGYVIYVQRLKSEDLKGDPFNARTKEDVGTVRVVTEQDPHGEDEEN